MDDITIVNVSLADHSGKLTHKHLKLLGEVNLEVLSELERYSYDFLDISEAEFGMDQEGWVQCLEEC